MRAELFWILSFCGFAALSLLCGILVWPQLVAAWPSIEEKIDRFRRLPPFAKVALLVFIAGFIAYGSTKTNQVGGVGLGLRPRSTMDDNLLCTTTTSDYDDPPPTVTPEDIARGWRLWEVRTNCNISYTMPEDATLATNWWVRGAYEDVKLFDFGSWRFSVGTNEYSSLWAFSWGKVRFALADTNAEIVAVGAPMSAVPYRSRLWTAETTNSTLITWEDFTLGRVPSADYQLPSTNYQLVSAQVELLTTGDFVTRSNEVESVYRRIDPEDWDGDGWRNDDDWNPCAWDDFGEMFYQELPEGANEAAYCWIEVRPKWNSDIWFYGDAPSNLDDPYIYGKAGETYRVQLLIGKTYDVESTQPLDIVAKSDDRIEVSNVEPDSFTVVWPVEFTVAEGRAPDSRPRLGATWNDGGKSFYVLPDPPWLRGVITWTDNYCCGVWGDGTNFTYACDNECTCEGCTAYGSYWYEGYGLPVWGISCGCHYVEDQGPAEIVEISFNHSAVIYEDSYTNQPGEVVHPARSNVVLHCEVSGGTYGGTVTMRLNDAAQQKLRKIRGDNLPNNVRVVPGGRRTFEMVYSVLEPSGSVGDIQAAALFHEDFLNEVHSNGTSMTSVKVELEAVYEAPANPNPSRHIYGVGEKVNFKVTPQSSEIKLKTAKLDVGDFNGVYELFDGITNEADADVPHVYVCPISANYHPPIRVELDTVEYWPRIELIEPQIIVTPEASWTSCHNMGEVGQSKLVTENFIGPMNVSFRGVMIAEIPCDEEIEPIGYFATTNFTGYRSHTMGSGGDGAGAGYSRRVQGRNRWTTDEAGGGLYPNWSPGRLEWKIPIGWSRVGRDEHEFGTLDSVARERFGDPNSRPLLIGGCTDAYKQVMTIDDNGTSKIEKFGHWLSRGRYCRIILDGETKQWFHPLW